MTFKDADPETTGLDLVADSVCELVPDVTWCAETSTAKRWSKSMEPVYSEGRLVPWEPET